MSASMRAGEKSQSQRLTRTLQQSPSRVHCTEGPELAMIKSLVLVNAKVNLSRSEVTTVEQIKQIALRQWRILPFTDGSLKGSQYRRQYPQSQSRPQRCGTGASKQMNGCQNRFF